MTFSSLYTIMQLSQRLKNKQNTFPCFDLWNCSLEGEGNGISETQKNSFPGGGRGDMPLNLISGSCLRRSIYLSLQCELPQKVRTAHLRIARDRWRESVTIADWRARSGCHSNSHNKLQIRVWLTPMRISILATNLKPSHTINKAEFLRLLLLI